MSRYKMSRVGGSHLGSFHVVAFIPHGNGKREVTIDVPRDVLTNLAKILTFPCCSREHQGESTTHACWHLVNAEFSPCEDAEWGTHPIRQEG